jgi:hypothetical protein
MRCCSVFHAVLAVCAVMPVLAAPTYVRTEQHGNRWLIGNDLSNGSSRFRTEADCGRNRWFANRAAPISLPIGGNETNSAQSSVFGQTAITSTGIDRFVSGMPKAFRSMEGKRCESSYKIGEACWTSRYTMRSSIAIRRWVRRRTASAVFYGTRFRCGTVSPKFEDRRGRKYLERGARIPEAHRSGPRVAGRPERDGRHRSLSV